MQVFSGIPNVLLVKLMFWFHMSRMSRFLVSQILQGEAPNGQILRITNGVQQLTAGGLTLY